MGIVIFKIFQTKLEVEMMVSTSGFGGARKCAGKRGWELNKNNDVVNTVLFMKSAICDVVRIGG